MRKTAKSYLFHLFVYCLLGAFGSTAFAKPRNVVFVLIDDLRYDTMSFLDHPAVETPAMDALAEQGVHFRNAFVTTSLCSPSRASFLTGMYAHEHGVLNNSTKLDPSIPTFARLLQEKDYQTAFVGKWHMGGASDAPRPGFDYWASFRGQGHYNKNNFNIDGKTVHLDEYVTDAITRLSTTWLRERVDTDKPFMLYMSHKAVHGPFTPAPRHVGSVPISKVKLPPSAEHSPENYYRKPKWVEAQRVSWHGIDDPYHKMYPERTLIEIIRDYYECIHAVDDSLATLVKTLKDMGVYDNTLIIFAGDNGFLWGEHGLIDKRCMYEESIRIPMIVSCPELYGSEARQVDRMVLNIDVAPTIIEAAGLDIPSTVQGQSFLQLPLNPDMKWRDAFVYLYFWERYFPETPSCLGIRTDRHKYIEYHGIWDRNELYDLEKDPNEMLNRLSTTKRKHVTPDDGYQKIYRDLQKRMYGMLDSVGARREPTWKK